MIKILLDVLINIDFIFFWKLINFNFFGKVICWLDGIIIFLLIWVFKEEFKSGEVDMLIWILFLDVM